MFDTGREISFRAKRIDNGEWVEGIPSYDENGNLAEMEVWKGFCNCVAYQTDSKTICQYTGLTDAKGTKIFEGDILKGGGKLYIMEFDSSKGAFLLRRNAVGSVGCFFGKTEAYYMEAVGNVFDNQELLNK